MESTPESRKSNGTGRSRNGTTMPPKAASTWRKTSRSSATSERAATGSTMPYSVVPTIPTRATVFWSIRSSSPSMSIRNRASSGAVRISSPRISPAFWNEKWLDAGTTTFGNFTGFCFFAIRSAWILDSVPPEVA